MLYVSLQIPMNCVLSCPCLLLSSRPSFSLCFSRFFHIFIYTVLALRTPFPRLSTCTYPLRSFFKKTSQPRAAPSLRLFPFGRELKPASARAPRRSPPLLSSPKVHLSPLLRLHRSHPVPIPLLSRPRTRSPSSRPAGGSWTSGLAASSPSRSSSTCSYRLWTRRAGHFWI